MSSSDNARRRRRKNRTGASGRRRQEADGSRNASRDDGYSRSRASDLSSFPQRSPSAYDDPIPPARERDRRERVRREEERDSQGTQSRLDSRDSQDVTGTRDTRSRRENQSRRASRNRQGGTGRRTGTQNGGRAESRGSSRNRRIAGTYGGTYGAEVLREDGTAFSDGEAYRAGGGNGYHGNRESGYHGDRESGYRAGGYGASVYAGGGTAVAETRLAASRRNVPAETDSSPRRRQKPGKRLKHRRHTLLLALLVLVAVLFTGNHFLFREPEQQMEPVHTQKEEPERPPFSSVSVIPEELRNLEVRENMEDGETPEPEDSVPEMEVPVQEDGSKTRKEHFFTFLLAGTDDNNGGSDTIILAALDAKENRITGISLPRDTKIYVNDTARKLNFAYRWGGMPLLSKTVSRQLGIPIDYTVEVDLQGFAALVDAIGGVDFYVPINMDYDDPSQDLYIGFEEGMQHLNGLEALKVVRFRHNWDGTGYGDEDFGRMRTQQNFLKAVAKKMLRPGNLTKVGKFVDIFQQYVKTDLTAPHMAWLGREAILIGADHVDFSTLQGEWKSPYIYLDRDKVLEILNETLNPYEEPITASDLHLAR